MYASFIPIKNHSSMKHRYHNKEK